MTARSVQTLSQLLAEHVDGVFVASGGSGGGPGGPGGGGGGLGAPPLARRIRDIFDSTVHGSPRAPVSFARDEAFHPSNPNPKGTA